jgi:uncharacterized membrane protein
LLLLGAVLAFIHAVTFALGVTFAPASDVGGEFDPALQRARIFAVPFMGYVHTLGSAIAAIIGPFQLLGAVRRRVPRVHVWLGRTYLVAVGLGGVSGFYLLPENWTHSSFGYAFALLAIVWLYTGVRAYTTIRRGDVAAHRRWILRNYACTYAAVTLRLQVPILIVGGGMDPVAAIDILGWVCWVPNLLLVEWWLRRRRSFAGADAPLF